MAKATRRQLGEALVEALNGYAHPMTCKGVKELRANRWGIVDSKCSCGAVQRRDTARAMAQEFVTKPAKRRAAPPTRED